MEQTFIVKKGNLFIPFLSVCFFGFIVLAVKADAFGILFPALLILDIALLSSLILYIRWMFSYVVLLDMDKREIVLNHSLFLRKKRISIDDIERIDTMKGNIFLSKNTPLSKLQRIVYNYGINLNVIEKSDRKRVLDLLINLKN